MVCAQSTSDNNIWDETLFQRYADSNSWTYDCTSRLAASEQWWFQCKQYRSAAATMRRIYNVIAHHSGGGESVRAHWVPLNVSLKDVIRCRDRSYVFHWNCCPFFCLGRTSFAVNISNKFLVCICALGHFFFGGNAFYILSHYILLQLAGMHVYSYAAILLGFSFHIYHKKLCMKCNYLSALAMLCKKALKTNYRIIHVYPKR